MITKTTKTILLAALIAAMILPFSGMQSVDATAGEGHDIPAPYSRESGEPDGSHASDDRNGSWRV